MRRRSVPAKPAPSSRVSRPHTRLVHFTESVRLVVSELATNALVHAHTPFSVTLVGHDDLVVLTRAR